MTTTAPAARRSLPEWDLTVVSSARVAPRMLRIALHCPGMERFSYVPGQALRILAPDAGCGTCERDYTIRRIDRATGRIDIDVLLHGDTPGPRWARGARPGDAVRARGPRSAIRLWPDRDWHLLAGDETAMPAILHMLETLPDGARAQAFIEIEAPEDRMEADLPPGAALDWILRESEAEAPLVRAVLEFALPAGRGQACLIGQTAVVQAMRRGLIARGMNKGDIAAEGYWRPGRTGGVIEALG